MSDIPSMREYIKSATRDLMSQAYDEYDCDSHDGEASFSFVRLDEWDDKEFSMLIKQVVKAIRCELNERSESSNFSFTVKYHQSMKSQKYHNIFINWTQEPIDNPFDEFDLDL